MARGGAKALDYKLKTAQILELEDTRPNPNYTDLVVFSDKLMVINGTDQKVALYSSLDGKLLTTSDKLQSGIQGICILESPPDILVCTALDNGKIEILSVESTTKTAVIQRIRTLDVTKGFDRCDGVKPLKVTKKDLVVSGVKTYRDTKEQWICWGIVSYFGGHVKTHKICKGDGWSYLATSVRGDFVYISCYTSSRATDNGVYSFGIKDGQRKFLYQHPDLRVPLGICVETRGFLYICNCTDTPSMYQLTEDGNLMAVHTEGIPALPLAIYWQDQQLFVTGQKSKQLRRFHVLCSDQVSNADVLNIDAGSLPLYKEALKDGKERVYNIRVMVVGQFGVGKTTLTGRLLGKDINLSKHQSTEGIDVHVDCGKVSLETKEWIIQKENAENNFKLQRFVNFLNEHVPKQAASGEEKVPVDKDEQGEKYQPMKTDLSTIQSKTSVKLSNSDASRLNTPSSPKDTPLSSESKWKEQNKDDVVMEIFQLVSEKSGELDKGGVKYASLAMWDFAGQYVFYTTHQAFLTRNAVYLLVLDLSQQVTDPVNDECFLDVEGTKVCKVHDLVEIWLNSIHSCAQSSEGRITPVILVGTHVDKIPEKSRQNVIDKYFQKIHQLLKDKPSSIHLMDCIAIDNTKQDPKLEELKNKIFELASKQPYWGEEKPVRWLPLEQKIMTLKISGVKVAPVSLIEDMNSWGAVRMKSSEELNQFLIFQHEIGTILYFNVEKLREKIVLNPQWLIDALRSLITAETFVRGNRAISSKWNEFKEKGKLTWELIDAVWTKDKNPEFYDNKDHIILVMEELNIIVKTRWFSQDGNEILMDDYFLAPCMLRDKMPEEVISLKSSHQMESSSVLCYVFTEKFLPPPIFHRFVAACLGYWPIAKEGSEQLIYCGCCVFSIDLSHQLILYTRNHIIFACVTRLDKRMPSTKLCTSVREFIEEMLSKTIKNLCYNLAFECSMKCPESKEDCLEDIIPVTKLKEPTLRCSFHSHHQILSHELKKFWFQAELSQGSENAHSVSCLPSNLQDKKPSEKDLGRLSLKIGKKYVLLGLELGITWVDIQQIQMDYRYTATQCLMILYKWTMQSGERATFGNLEKACRSAEIYADIHKSIKMTGIRPSWPPNEKLDKNPEVQQLLKICRRIGKEYVHLGVELGVPVNRIEQIQMEHQHDVPTQCFKILKEWIQRGTTQATFICLEEAFHCIGINPSILDECLGD